MKSCAGDSDSSAARPIDRDRARAAITETRALRIASLDFDELTRASAMQWHHGCSEPRVAVCGREETMQRHRTILAVLCGVALFAIGCGSSTSPTTVSSLTVTCTAPAIGTTSQFKATATMGDGTTQDVTALAAWSSSNASVATVSSAGVVSGLAAGSVSVAAVYQSVSGSDAIVLVP